jgi:hypothetical protein
MTTVRCCLLVLGAAFACAATEPPPPPAALQPYIRNGRFDPGDYGWMKGRFDEATPAEKQTYENVQEWVRACRDEALAGSRAALREAGFADTRIANIITGPLLCQEVGFQPLLPKGTTFAAFGDELARARPVAESYLFAVRNAEQANATSSEDLRELLERRTLGEQMVRLALSWGQGAASDAPPLTLLGKAIVQSMIGRAMARHDHDNTEWLKGVVAEHGWPRISEVGKEAAGKAWLLVQHADADPLFQLQALRLMEPLVAKGEVSQQNYAYLYDRVMLKLAGKQRYGTQATCIEGRFRPQSLEDEARLDELRAEVGLDPEAKYLAMMDEMYGHCQNPS